MSAFIIATMILMGIVGLAQFTILLSDRGILRIKGRTGSITETELSWPAQQVMKAYRAIPEAHRPAVDLRDTLEAMDLSYGGAKEVSRSYNEYKEYASLTPVYGWGHGRSAAERTGNKPYRELFSSMQAIKAALDAQEHEFMMAGISHRLGRVSEIMEAAKREKEIIEETTAFVITKEVS